MPSWILPKPHIFQALNICSMLHQDYQLYTGINCLKKFSLKPLMLLAYIPA